MSPSCLGRKGEVMDDDKGQPLTIEVEPVSVKPKSHLEEEEE